MLRVCTIILPDSHEGEEYDALRTVGIESRVRPLLFSESLDVKVSVVETDVNVEMIVL